MGTRQFLQNKGRPGAAAAAEVQDPQLLPRVFREQVGYDLVLFSVLRHEPFHQVFIGPCRICELSCCNLVCDHVFPSLVGVRT
jgi:hypothetical protein